MKQNYQKQKFVHFDHQLLSQYLWRIFRSTEDWTTKNDVSGWVFYVHIYLNKIAQIHAHYEQHIFIFVAMSNLYALAVRITTTTTTAKFNWREYIV